MNLDPRPMMHIKFLPSILNSHQISLILLGFIYQAFYKVYQDGKKLKAAKIHQHEADKEAVMNMDVNFVDRHFAAGMDNVCRLYSYKIEERKKKNATESKVIVKEIGHQTTAKGGDDDDAEYQKCVRFNIDGKLMAVASSEGQVKIMKVSHFAIFLVLPSTIQRLRCSFRRTMTLSGDGTWISLYGRF